VRIGSRQAAAIRIRTEIQVLIPAHRSPTRRWWPDVAPGKLSGSSLCYDVAPEIESAFCNMKKGKGNHSDSGAIRETFALGETNI